jgi:ARG/rhodanese/phosphatase superfamily protein
MKNTFVITLAVVLLAIMFPLGILIRARVQTGPSTGGPGKGGQGGGNQASDYHLSGAYTHKNLTIFLIHGKNLIEGKTPLTLQEALEQKKVIVYETKEVNELSIENVSSEDVYVQSGDIVKGGQQDRLLAVDLIVPPKSGKIPIAAFCVEQGRWSKRGDEQAAHFDSSADAAPTKDIKLAAKRANSQSGVWKNVSVAQEKMSRNLSVTVNSSSSPSSLQLAVENNTVQENASGYTQALLKIVDGKADVIGYAFAINGNVNSADVYASTGLFLKLWPKLLKANAVEAIAELRNDAKFEPATVDQVKSFIAEAEAGKSAEKEVTGRIELSTREDEKNILFETRDRSRRGAWIHRNYIRK